MAQSDRSDIPKFGSFKPRTRTSAADVFQSNDENALRSPRSSVGHTRSQRPDPEARSKHRKRNDHDPEQRKLPEDSDKRSQHRNTLDNNGARRDRRHAALSTDELEESPLYIVDKRGDGKNVEYGSLHRYSIPTHHRTGYGRVLGAPSVRINRDESSEKSIIVDRLDARRSEHAGKPLTSISRKALHSTRMRLVVPTATTAKLDAQEDFVSLRPNLKRKLGQMSPELLDEGLQHVDYRSIDGKAKSDARPEDVDLEYASDSDEDGVPNHIEANTRKKSAALAKRAKEHPCDADAWFDLIEHQAEMIRPGVHTDDLTRAERRSLADVRLSIYGQALKRIERAQPGRDRLLLGMIQEGGLVWDTAKLSSKWREVLTGNANNFTLWCEYLGFVQTKHIGFKYQQCRATYIQCLNIFQAALANAPPAEKAEIREIQLYVFLRFTSFTRDSGYDELANAMWQALLEYQLVQPSDTTSAEAPLQVFGDFWDSDHPRIGEERAGVRANQRETFARRAQPMVSETAISMPPFREFTDQESRTSAELHLPAAIDDESLDDPYRHVMLSDLEKTMASLVADLPAHTTVNGFLMYMGLPLLADSSDAAYSWQVDQFLRAFPMDLESEPANNLALDLRTIANVRPTTFALFHNTFDSHRSPRRTDVQEAAEKARFVDRVLCQLVQSRRDDDALAEYSVAFKLHFFPTEVLEYAKSLLKTRSTSVRLYNAYALTEAHRKRIEKARGVWSTAANMADTLGQDAKHDMIVLWHSWMKTEIAHGENMRALQCLLAMNEGVVNQTDNQNLCVTPAQKLKCSSYFRGSCEDALHAQRSDHAAMHAGCHMYFDYLTENMSLEAVTQICATYTSRWRSNTFASELLCQVKIELLRIHIDHKRPYKPAKIRAELVEDIKTFPSNSALLNLLDKLDARFLIIDRIREPLLDPVNTVGHSNLVSSHHSIIRELRRYRQLEASGSTQHSVRRAFVSALQDPSSGVKHSPVLWRMWFDFEKSCTGEQTRERARQVFLDGLRYLPWNKAWVILGLQYLATDGITVDKELRQIYDVLVEREIRIRVEIEGS